MPNNEFHTSPVITRIKLEICKSESDNHHQQFRWFHVGSKLITSHQVDYLSSAPIPAEAVENNQEYLVANKVGIITLLV